MKKFLSILLAVSMLGCLTGCGAETAPAPETAAASQPTEALPSRITYSDSQGGQALIIEAEVAYPDHLPTERVLLSYDADARDRLFDTLIENPSDLAHPDESGRIVGITFDTESTWDIPGHLYFEDHRMTDWEEQSLDGEHFFDPGYITPLKPGNFQKSAQEVLEELAGFLEDYSCLELTPLRAEAREGKTGAYYWAMDAGFEGIPIRGRNLISVGGQVRETGLEAIQGDLLLKEAERSPIPDPMTLTEALERLKTDWNRYSYAESTKINEVTFCYQAYPDHGKWILSPAWVFLGEESKANIAPYEEYHNGDNAGIAFIYEIQDGFLDVREFNRQLVSF